MKHCFKVGGFKVLGFTQHHCLLMLCCWSVDCITLEVSILKYDYKLVLNIKVKNYPLILNFHPLNFLLFHIFQLYVYLFNIILSLPMTFAKCLCKLWKVTIRKFRHVIMAPIQCCISYHIVKWIDDILLSSFCICFHCKIEHFDMNI